jgi:hypothetical protein
MCSPGKLPKPTVSPPLSPPPPPDPDIKTPSHINQVLAQLFSAVSLRKINLRQGALLAYIAQLMIQTTKVADTRAQLPKSQ